MRRDGSGGGYGGGAPGGGGGRGRLAAGLRADFAVWGVEHPNELSYWFGRNPCERVVHGGEERP